MTTVPMSVQDALWLTMDRPNNLMIVDGAMVLAGTPTLEQVRAVYVAAREKFPVFGRKAVPYGHGWAWQDDENFEMAEHVTQATLGDSTDMRALQVFMGEQRSVPLEMDRPRWRSVLVTGLILPDGSEGSAVVTRFHHSITPSPTASDSPRSSSGCASQTQRPWRPSWRGERRALDQADQRNLRKEACYEEPELR
jgi:hypothetical protein